MKPISSTDLNVNDCSATIYLRGGRLLNGTFLSSDDTFTSSQGAFTISHGVITNSHVAIITSHDAVTISHGAVTSSQGTFTTSHGAFTTSHDDILFRSFQIFYLNDHNNSSKLLI